MLTIVDSFLDFSFAAIAKFKHKYSIANYWECIIGHNWDSYFSGRIVHITVHCLHCFIYSHKTHRLIESITLISTIPFQILGSVVLKHFKIRHLGIDHRQKNRFVEFLL